MPVMLKIVGFLSLIAGLSVLGYADGQAMLGTILTLGGFALFVAGRLGQAS